jgi:hypothetical protein
VEPHLDEVATDFRFPLIAKTRFPRDETIIEIRYASEGEDEPVARATTYRVRVRYTKTLSILELILYKLYKSESVFGRQAGIDASPEYLS